MQKKKANKEINNNKKTKHTHRHTDTLGPSQHIQPKFDRIKKKSKSNKLT